MVAEQCELDNLIEALSELRSRTARDRELMNVGSAEAGSGSPRLLGQSFCEHCFDFHVRHSCFEKACPEQEVFLPQRLFSPAESLTSHPKASSRVAKIRRSRREKVVISS